MMSTKENKSRIDDTEIIISKALRIGVMLSAIIIGIGLAMLIITGYSGYPGDTFPTSTVDILSGFIQIRPYAIILTGLIVLILTPVFRVGVSIITFLMEKDYLYVGITSLVFVILIISFFLGK